MHLRPGQQPTPQAAEKLLTASKISFQLMGVIERIMQVAKVLKFQAQHTEVLNVANGTTPFLSRTTPRCMEIEDHPSREISDSQRQPRATDEKEVKSVAPKQPEQSGPPSIFWTRIS